MKRILLHALALLTICSAASAEDVQGIVLPVKQVSISSPVFQDTITAVLVEEGDTVTEGQELLKLRSEKEELEVRRTQKVVELSEFKARGAQSLFDDKMGSREKALEEQAQLEVQRLVHQLAQVALREKTIRSPLSGIVVKKYKETGEGVERVEKLFDIVNIDQIYIQFYLDPKLMGSLKEGQKVQVRFPALGPTPSTASITFIDPRIDAASGLFRLKLQMENPGHRIKAGTRGAADFSTIQPAPPGR